MKKSKRKLLLLFIILLSSNHSLTSFSQTDTVQIEENSKIVLIREDSYVGSAINYTVLANNEEVILIRNNSYHSFECKPGDYTFTIKEDKSTALNIKALPGQTHYIRFGLRTGFWTSRPELMEVTENYAQAILNNRRIRKIENENTRFILPKNSLGIEVVMGGGIRSEEVIILDNGGTASFSYGGGFGIGAQYAYQFHRNFELKIGANYESSTLSPRVKNVEMYFRRAKAGITPRFVIPLRDGETMRLKLGAGLDYYFWNNFKLHEPFTPVSITHIYDKAFGYHGEFLFDMNVGSATTFYYGLKWNGAIFNTNSPYIPVHSFFSNPNANELMLLLGVTFYF